MHEKWEESGFDTIWRQLPITYIMYMTPIGIYCPLSVNILQTKQCDDRLLAIKVPEEYIISLTTGKVVEGAKHLSEEVL